MTTEFFRIPSVAHRSALGLQVDKRRAVQAVKPPDLQGRPSIANSSAIE